MKTILIAVAIPGFDFYNKHSAVAGYLLSIKEGLEEYGYKVVLSPGQLQSDSKAAGPRPLNRVKQWIQLLKFSFRKVFPVIYHSLSDRIYLRSVKNIEDNILDTIEADHVIEFLSYGSMAGYRYSVKKNIPLTVIFDAPIQEQAYEMKGCTTLYRRYVQDAERLSIERADNIICYSQPVKTYLLQHFVTKGEIFILPTINWANMTPKQVQKEEGTEVNIGFIGSFLKWHKVDLLVDVFDEFSEKYKNARLVLIGYGLEWENIRKKIEGMHSKERIILTGFVNDEQLSYYKSLIDIGVMPGSNWYGSPLKIFEYACLRIAVIAPSTPTIQDMFEKEREVLFIDPENEYKSLYDHLEKLLSNKETYHSLASGLFDKVTTRFDKRKYFDIFNGILNKDNTEHGHKK